MLTRQIWFSRSALRYFDTYSDYDHDISRTTWYRCNLPEALSLSQHLWLCSEIGSLLWHVVTVSIFHHFWKFFEHRGPVRKRVGRSDVQDQPGGLSPEGVSFRNPHGKPASAPNEAGFPSQKAGSKSSIATALFSVGNDIIFILELLLRCVVHLWWRQRLLLLVGIASELRRGGDILVFISITMSGVVENSSDQNNIMLMCCASCGVAEVDDIKLMTCAACKSARYCGVKCQREHRRQHKKDCKKRAAELRDEILFKQPESSYLGDCPICMMPLSIDQEYSTIMMCCSKKICNGCYYFNEIREAKESLIPSCSFQLPQLH